MTNLCTSCKKIPKHFINNNEQNPCKVSDDTVVSMDNLTVPQFESVVQITQWVSHKVRNVTSRRISGFTEPDAKICFYSHELTFSTI